MSDLATPWTAAYQAPPTMGFSRQEYWSGVPLPSPIYTIDIDIMCEIDEELALIYCDFYSVYLRIVLEKAMAPHSSTLAWKIPWTEEPGGLQSVELLRVGHD